jgi:hypothetical protein
MGKVLSEGLGDVQKPSIWVIMAGEERIRGDSSLRASE